MNTKQKKSKGPIRFEAIIPMAIVVALIWGYFHFFFDSHIKWGIEYGVTRLNGAEVDVASIRTSVWQGSFELNGLQVTDAENPEKNIFEIGRVHFKFLWDALLRMKFVVDDASIEQFLVNTKRSRPGFVLPKPKDPDIEKAESETGGSALAEAGQLIQGALPAVNANELDNLKSLQKIKGLQSELENKQKEWQQNIESLPTEKDLNDLRSRITNVKVGGTSDPMEIQKQITDVSSLVNEVNQKTNDIKTKANNIQSDVDRFSQDIGGLNKLVEQDIKALEAKLKLPRLDVESISKQFFGPQVLEYVRKARRYIDVAQKYMPPVNSKEERKGDRIQAPTRQVGKNFEFPRANSYPLFWLKRAALSSKSEGSPFGGDVSGELLDVTSNPPLIGKPVIFKLAGDFPQQNVRGVDIKATFDHRGTVASQSLVAKVANFGVEGKILSESEQVKFGFKQASAGVDLVGSHRGGIVGLKVVGAFNKIDYITESNNDQIREIISTAAKDLSVVNFQAVVGGPFTDLNFSVTSNIGESLQRSFERQIKGKIDEARKKLEDAINVKIGGEKKALTQQFGSAESTVKSQVDKKNKEVDKIKGQADAKLTEAKKQVADQGTKAVDDIRKKLGF